MADAVQPHLQRLTGASFRSFLARHLRGITERRVPRFPWAIDVPEVREYIRQMAVHFSITVNNTSTEHARDGQAWFRRELGRLSRADVHYGSPVAIWLT